jgi:hypothetical protein
MNYVRWARTQWDRVSAWCLIGFGGIAIMLGWNGVSSEPLTAQQVPYIVSGGIGGLFLLGVGAMLWLSADLRDEWRKLDAIERNTQPSLAAGQPEDDPFARSPGGNGASPTGAGAAAVASTTAVPARRTRRTKPLAAR